MFVIIWAALLLAVRSNEVNTVDPSGETSNITADAGLCVVMPCYFTAPPGFPLESAALYKCEEKCVALTQKTISLNNNTNPVAQSGLRGRVSLLEPGVNQRNFSIIINDLTTSDSGSYELRVQNETKDEYTICRAAITIKDLTQKPTVMIPALTEGQQTTLTCTAPGLCSGSEPKITWMWRGAGGKHSHITGNITAFKSESLTSVTQRHSSNLTFNPSAEHHGTKVTCRVSFINDISTEETVTLNVTYVRKSDTTGKTTVKESNTLNLTCNVESFPPSLFMGTMSPSNKNLHNGTESNPQKMPGRATLVIHNVTAEHTGQYICTSKHPDATTTTYTNVTVTSFPEILNSSGCKMQSKVLTCWCISRGLPVPIVKWRLFERHTEFSVVTTVSHHTVNSTISLTVEDQSNTVAECVSSNEKGEVKRSISINKEEEQKEGQYLKFLRILIQLEVIIGFLTGALLSAIICCLVRKCHRKKQRNFGNLAETLEMVISHRDLKANAGQAVEDDQAINPEPAEGEVEYSDLEFNLIKRQAAAEEGAAKGTTETEYAEIKKEKAEEGEDGKGTEEEVMIGEDEESKHCVNIEEEDEDAALYSTVKDVMDQI